MIEKLFKNNGFSCTWIALLWLCCIACKEDEVVIDSSGENSNSIESITKIFLEWDSSVQDVKDYSDDLTLKQNHDGSILFYENKDASEKLTYKFHGDKLVCATLLVSAGKAEGIKERFLKNYRYLGDISSGDIFENSKLNTISCFWKNFTDEKAAIGFAPIDSDILDAENPYGVTTSENVSLEPFKVTLSGVLHGEYKDASVGIQISDTPSFIKSRNFETKSSSGEFSIQIKGVIDQFTYYYRAFAEIEGVKLYGEIKSFTTDKLVYYIDGKQYDMIIVEGGPFGDFSMMQTELPLTSSMEIGDLKKLPITGKYFTKAYYRELYSIFARSGLPWRLPTVAEYIIAATGGNKTHNYLYAGGNILDKVAWYNGNANGPQEIAIKDPNELGFYDLTGNYSELIEVGTEEYIKNNDYNSGASVNARWNNLEAYGGNWNSSADQCKIGSYYKVTTAAKENQIDLKTLTFRFVYSRDPLYLSGY